MVLIYMVKKEANLNVNPFVAIGPPIVGTYLVVVLFFLIFASTQAVLLVPIAWAFVTLGIFLGLFAYLSGKNKKK